MLSGSRGLKKLIYQEKKHLGTPLQALTEDKGNIVKGFFSLLVLSIALSFHSFASERKSLLISGGSGGIGREVALTFAKEGWHVWAGYCSSFPKDLEGVPNISPIHLDVTQQESIAQAVQSIQKAEGRLDVLVNNAGVGLLGAVEESSPQQARALFEVNFFGALELTKAILPIMREQKSGKIINISSTSGVRAVPGLGLYAASKFALEAVSEALAAELSPWNIDVSIIEPGSVKNHWVENCWQSDQPMESSSLAKGALTKLSALAKSGQDCSEIAQVIYQVALRSFPSMRYQTSLAVTETVAKKLTDPSGDRMKLEMQSLFEAFNR